MSVPAIAIQNLSFSYDDAPSVLNSVEFEVPPGEKTAIVGPNGSGKTSLFLLLSGVHKPESGTIYIEGKRLVHNRFDGSVGYLFQSPDDQLFSARVYDDVAFGPINMGLPERQVRQKTEEALEWVGCPDLKEKPPHHLSGGEKRLVALASVLSMDPKVLLLDEPTSNLDLRNRRTIIGMLNRLDITMLISSHDLEFLLETCSRVLILDSGRIAATGPIREIFADEELMREHHLEKPHSLIPHRHGISNLGLRISDCPSNVEPPNLETQ